MRNRLYGLHACALTAFLAFASIALLLAFDKIAYADNVAETVEDYAFGDLCVGEDVVMPSGISGEDIEAVVSQLPAEGTSRSVPSPVSVESYAGESMFETAASIALAAYPGGCDTAVIAGAGDAWVDALSASGLAGSRGPVLFCWRDSLPAATADALRTLGVGRVVVVGGQAAVSDEVVAQLSGIGIALEARLAGDDAFGTQLAIFEYGCEHGLWDPGMIVVATGTGFGDALSVSPVAYARRAPVFLTGADGGFSPEQKDALVEAASLGYGAEVVVVGGEAVVSNYTVGFCDFISAFSGGSGSTVRLAGPTQYETSAAIAEWAVSSQGFTWSSPAFATGLSPYDGLAGAVLQGEARSPLLLVDLGYSAVVDETERNKESLREIRFLGGTAAVSNTVRYEIYSRLLDSVSFEDAGIDMETMAELESSAGGLSSEDALASLDPLAVSPGDPEFFQFAVLNERLTDGASAEMLNDFITQSGSDGQLAGKGQAFIDAATRYGINEVYLMAHAILESGWGKSELAKGWTFDEDVVKEDGSVIKATGKTYYNFFGIGAYDSSPLSGGRLMAYQQDWDTPEKAIEGAARFIASNYLNNQWSQNTLYKMRWNYLQAASDRAVWHQYATDKKWATGISKVMSSFYSSYGIDYSDAGIRFLVPAYS